MNPRETGIKRKARRPPSPSPFPPMTIPIRAFCRSATDTGIAGIGINTAYELIAAGKIQAVKIGRNTLIIVASWDAYVAEQAHNALRPTPTPDRRKKPRPPLSANAAD
jgi:hypothetical protein